LNWQHIPEAMAAMAQREAEQDAALQVALDTHRATSWWAWLTTPAHPPKRGCEALGLF
jgi:hypothetical protein